MTKNQDEKKNQFIKKTLLSNQTIGLKEFLDISKNWEFIIRHWIKDYIKPTKLIFEKEIPLNGHLYLNVNKFIIMKFESMKPQIKNWVNIYFAKEIISKVIGIPSI